MLKASWASLQSLTQLISWQQQLLLRSGGADRNRTGPPGTDSPKRSSIAGFSKTNLLPSCYVRGMIVPHSLSETLRLHCGLTCHVSGAGRPLLFLHGWPFHAATYRRLIPLLEKQARCIAVDLPGSGATDWSGSTDFGFLALADLVSDAISELGLEQCDVLAHDSGATVARYLALKDRRVRRLILLNTEVPGHRPPWIRMFRLASRLPGSSACFRALLGSPQFRSSAQGFGGCFSDPSLIEGEFSRLFVEPLISDKRKLEGTLRRLRGIDFRLVDALQQKHQLLRAPVLLVWGTDDPTFPIGRARAMLTSFAPGAELREVRDTKLLPHEERPSEVAAAVTEFLARRPAGDF